MRELPKLRSEQQIEVPNTSLNTPGLDAINRLGENFQRFGSSLVSRGSKQMILGSAQQGATDLESRALTIKEDSVKKFSNPADQKLYFNNSYKAYAESYVSKAPFGAQAYLKKTADHNLLVNNVLFDNKIEQQQKMTSQINYYSHQQENYNNMTHALAIGDFGNPATGTTGGSQKIYQQIVTSARMAAEHGIITPQQMNQEIKTAQRSYQSGNFLFHVQQQLDNQNIDGAENLISSVDKNGLPGYSPTEVFGVTSKARTLVNNYKLGHAVNLYQINQNAKDNLDNARHTGRINKQWTSDFIAVNPKRADQYQNQLNENLDIFHQVTELTSMPREFQQEKLAKIKESENFDKFSAINNDLRSANTKIDDDAYSFFLKNKGVEESLLQHERAVNGAKGIPLLPTDELVRAHPIQSNLDAQKIYGVPEDKYGVMPKDAAKQLVAKLDQLPMQQRVLELNGIQKKYGGNAYIALSQLSRNGMPLANQMALAAINRTPQYGGAITRAFSVPFNKIQEVVGDNRQPIDEQVTNSLTDYLNTIHYNALEPSKINEITQSVEQLAYQLNIDGQDSSTAAKNAADIMINSHYNYLTLVRNTTRLPKEINEKTARELSASLLASITTMDVKVPPFFNPELTEKERQFNYKQQILFNGDVNTNENDSGLIVVSPNGDPVLDKNGNRIEIPFDDFSVEEQKRKKKLIGEDRKFLKSQGVKHLFDQPGEIDVP